MASPFPAKDKAFDKRGRLRIAPAFVYTSPSDSTERKSCLDFSTWHAARKASTPLLASSMACEALPQSRASPSMSCVPTGKGRTPLHLCLNALTKHISEEGRRRGRHWPRIFATRAELSKRMGPGTSPEPTRFNSNAEPASLSGHATGKHTAPTDRESHSDASSIPKTSSESKSRSRNAFISSCICAAAVGDRPLHNWWS